MKWIYLIYFYLRKVKLIYFCLNIDKEKKEKKRNKIIKLIRAGEERIRFKDNNYELLIHWQIQSFNLSLFDFSSFIFLFSLLFWGVLLF